jgi:hypothetical protein
LTTTDLPLPEPRWVQAIRDNLTSQNVPHVTADWITRYFADLEFDDVWLPDKILAAGAGGPVAVAFRCLGRSVTFIFRAPLDMRIIRHDSFSDLCDRQTGWARPLALLNEGRAVLNELYGSWLTSPDEDALKFWAFDAAGERDAFPVRPFRKLK